MGILATNPSHMPKNKAMSAQMIFLFFGPRIQAIGVASPNLKVPQTLL
jgi:hypothetical protein